MLTTRLSRREALDLLLGASMPSRGVLKSTTGVVFGDDSSAIDAFWTSEPLPALPLPELVVIPDGSEKDLLVAINASPHSPTPITALTRILTRSEALALFDSPPINDFGVDLLPAATALALVEAVVLSEGRVPLRHVTPALCKRTLSFTWGRALAARSPENFMEKLPARWIESYEIVNNTSAQNSLFRASVSALIGPLSICAQLASGLLPPSLAGKLAYACFRRDRRLQDEAWAALAKTEGGTPSLASIASATREERGIYRSVSIADSDESSIAACAFIATQVAPGSLEHFEVLRGASHPSIVFWYALYASLQTPSDILGGLGGLGLRVLRDVSQTTDYVGRPTADIAFSELKALERVGVEGVMRKFGHLGEVEVELVPLVTCSFSCISRSARTRNEPVGQLPLESDVPTGRREQSLKMRLRQAMALVSDVLREMPETEIGEQPSPKRGAYSTARRSKVPRDTE
jgi:hypothetical protein